MEHVDIVLASTKGPVSTLIKSVTWSKWSHTAMVMPDDTIIESTFKDGVHYATKESLLVRSDYWAIIRVPVFNQAEVHMAMHSLVGKKYDLVGALGIGIHRNLQDDDEFWCSEATYWAIHNGGTRYFRMEVMRRITPEHFWQQNFEIISSFGI